MLEIKERMKIGFILHETHNQYVINSGNFICYDKLSSTSAPQLSVPTSDPSSAFEMLRFGSPILISNSEDLTGLVVIEKCKDEKQEFGIEE